jgi:hypothetical protein
VSIDDADKRTRRLKLTSIEDQKTGSAANAPLVTMTRFASNVGVKPRGDRQDTWLRPFSLTRR